MKSQARAIVQGAANPRQARLLLREYLQHLILRQLFEQKILQQWIFHGGTALRIIYGLNRFSEDLDFHLRTPDSQYSLTATVKALCRNLELQGYRISESRIVERTVLSAFISFEQLLYEFNLSPHSNAKLSVKIELDTNPPGGFDYRQTLVNQYFPFGLIIHDLPTFLAGKLHALIQRPFTKGRDYYDLVFLLSRWQELIPNITYLRNALRQTNYRGEEITEHNWRNVILDIISKTNWDRVIKDVEPFLESVADLQSLNRENLNVLLGGNG